MMGTCPTGCLPVDFWCGRLPAAGAGTTQRSLYSVDAWTTDIRDEPPVKTYDPATPLALHAGVVVSVTQPDGKARIHACEDRSRFQRTLAERMASARESRARSQDPTVTQRQATPDLPETNNVDDTAILRVADRAMTVSAWRVPTLPAWTSSPALSCSSSPTG